MRILAIETSCDETAIAILEISEKQNSPKFNLLSNQVLSQIKIHKPYGGVVPNLATREHRKNLPIILKRALEKAEKNMENGLSSHIKNKIDAVAVTYGPGLEPALWEGINFAKNLAEKWKTPLVPVNHLEGHIYASWLESEPPKFPLLALIVSGGHTELVLMKKHLDYKILGETRDDASGEAFDKVARMLKLGYPGGPAISQLAGKWKPEAQNPKSEIKFPRPMINSPDLNFSFSGLKTAVLYYLRDNPNANKSAVANAFQQAVVDVLVSKTRKALQKYSRGQKPIKSLVIGGGVAANSSLRLALEHLSFNAFPKISLHISPLWLCGDNAAMIAIAAYFKTRAGKSTKPKNIKAQGNLKLNETCR